MIQMKSIGHCYIGILRSLSLTSNGKLSQSERDGSVTQVVPESFCQRFNQHWRQIFLLKLFCSSLCKPLARDLLFTIVKVSALAHIYIDVNVLL